MYIASTIIAPSNTSGNVIKERANEHISDHGHTEDPFCLYDSARPSVCKFDGTIYGPLHRIKWPSAKVKEAEMTNKHTEYKQRAWKRRGPQP